MGLGWCLMADFVKGHLAEELNCRHAGTRTHTHSVMISSILFLSLRNDGGVKWISSEKTEISF
jgi:hypothetical protein